MNEHFGSGSWSRSLAAWTALLAVGWTATIAVLLLLDYRQIRQQTTTLAEVDAQASFERDLAFRRWTAHHGGLYVPVTEDTPPNPYLAHVPERDLVTPSGRQLTLMNSAYVSRQFNEWYADPGGTHGRVSSLKPLRPENAPDPWEVEALKAFELGEQQVLAASAINGAEYMRLMRPVITEPACLKCHGIQGHQVGDIRGGISVSVPMANYESAAAKARFSSTVGHAALWLVGMTGICSGGLIVSRRARDQRRSDLARLDSERKFRVIFNQSFHLAGVLAPDGSILDINNCALDFAGIELSEVAGRPFWDGPWWEHDPAVRARVKEAVESVASGAAAVRFESTHRDRSGTLRIIDFSLRPVVDDSGVVRLLVPEGRDITESKQAEREKARLGQQLAQAQKLESIGRLAGGVAHDFNNLLSPIMGYTDLLMTRKPDDHPDRAELQAIMEAARRARDLTRQLLACARKQPLQTQPLDLNAIITGFCEVLQGSLRHDIRLELRLDNSTGPVNGDARQIEQILLNLVLNAQDAMPDGGRVVIETFELIMDEETHDAHSVGPGQYVCMSVTDTGTGMDRQTAEQVFEPFFTTKQTGKGIGLGLSTVYGIVKQHGGHIELRTQPGKGTTFVLYLPRSDEAISVEGTAAVARGMQDGRETILVVEDNEQVLRLVRGILTQAGYEVLAAADGRTAQDIAASHPGPIHLLISDVVMPDLDGKTLHDLLIAQRPETRVLFMSGYTADIIDPERVLDWDVHFIQKPFTLDEFSGKVRQILDQNRTSPRP